MIFQFLSISNHVLFVYYLCSNFVYLFLLILAFITSAHHQRRRASTRL